MTGAHPDDPQDPTSRDSGRRDGRWRGFLEHPENDLTADADFANRRPPEPHTAEELASSVDPAVQAARNTQSTRQAIQWLIAIPAITFGLALILGIIFRVMGGPACDAGEASFLCTRDAQIWWSVITGIPPIVGVLGCAFIMNHKLKNYTRWRPWMGVFWVMIPFCMIWLITAGQILIIALNS